MMPILRFPRTLNIKQGLNKLYTSQYFAYGPLRSGGPHEGCGKETAR